MMHGAFTQLWQAVKSLIRRPLFTALCVVTLALGIGGSVAVFSVVHSVLLEPLPVEDPDALVSVWHTAPGFNIDRLYMSPALFLTYREHNRIFDGIGMWNTVTATITGIDEPERVEGVAVTAGTLELLGLRPVLGRGFTVDNESPDSSQVVILGHGYWLSRFGGGPEVIGTTLIANGVAQEIIGVLPPDAVFIDSAVDLIFPFEIDRADLYFGNFSHGAIARLAPGATIEEANRHLAQLLDVAMEQWPPPPGMSMEMARDAGMAPNIQPLKQDVVGDVGAALWLILGTVGIVLLVAAANVANLFLVRAEGLRRERGIRAALGAGKGRLAAEQIMECTMLAGAAGVLGLWLAWAGIRLLLWLEPQQLPRLHEISIDGPVLAFAAVTSLITGLLFGLFPALRLRTADVATALEDGGRGASGGRRSQLARSTLVVAQVAAALVLLIGSGLMIRSFVALRLVHPGFEDPEHVQSLQIFIPSSEVEDPLEVVGIHEAMATALAGVAGVESVGAASRLPMARFSTNDAIFVEQFPTGDGEMPPIYRQKRVLPGYFQTMGNPVIAGQAIEWTDVHDRESVAVVTRDFVDVYWDDPGDAVGQRIRSNQDDPWRTIIGVVESVRDDGLDQDTVPIVFWPAAMNDFWGSELTVARDMTWVIRSPRVGTQALVDELRTAVRSAHSNLPLAEIRTLDDILRRSMARTSFTLVMLAIAAAVALLLGVVGVYGVTSYSVSQRTREIGVRLALGAQRRDVVRLVVGHGLILAGTGVVIGTAAAAALTRLMSGLLFGVNTVDPITYTAVALALGAMALAASYLPARRAAGLDPVDALQPK